MELQGWDSRRAHSQSSSISSLPDKEEAIIRVQRAQRYRIRTDKQTHHEANLLFALSLSPNFQKSIGAGIPTTIDMSARIVIDQP
jgi:hypothetical protein